MIPNFNITQEREAKILEKAAETFGAELQIIIAIEECSELIKALTKYVRYGKKPDKEKDKRLEDITNDIFIEDIREEMADVSIMLNQLALIFGDTNDEEAVKLTALETRLNILGVEI